jgi:hypothetical protein
MEDELRDELRQAIYPSNAHAEVPGAVAAYIERCIPLVLIDVVLADVNSRFNVSDFSQEMEGLDSPQAAYDEAVLSAEGAVLERGVGCADHLRNGRIAFYLHYFDPSRPLRWTYGSVDCPPAQLIPTAMLTLLPYHAVNEDEDDEDESD